MRMPSVHDTVRLVRDVPQCELHRGDVGFLYDVSCHPLPIYEVEFPRHEPVLSYRILLLEDQIEATDGEVQ